MTTEKLIDDATLAFTDRLIAPPSRDNLRIALRAFEASLARCGCEACTTERRQRVALTDHDRTALARVLHEIVYSPGANYDRAVPGIQEYALACAEKVAAALPWIAPHTPTGDEKEALADRLARRLIGDPKQLMLAEGTGALHVALSDSVRSAIEDVYADCGDSDPGVLSSNIGKRLAWDLPAAILADPGFRRSEVPEPSAELSTEQRHTLVEGAVDAIERSATNRTHAYNIWNTLASDERFVRAILTLVPQR